jgi:BBSome-interacting protein 1
MSLSSTDKEVSFVFPKSGNLFYEKKKELKFCKPILLPIRSVTLEKLEKMQLEAQKQLKVKTADSKDS